MLLLIVGLAIVISSLFSFPWGEMVGFILPPAFRFGLVPLLLSLLFSLALPVVIARWALNRLGVQGAASRLVGGRRLIAWGIGFYVAYWLLTSSGFLLSAIPYGGGAVPGGLIFVQFLAKGLVLVGLWKALLYELPSINSQVAETQPLSQ